MFTFRIWATRRVIEWDLVSVLMFKASIRFVGRLFIF